MSFEEKILIKKQIKQKLERLKKELTCQVCMGLFKDPQTMPCAHSYCKQCINNLWRNSKQREEGKFKCPQCRKLTSKRAAMHSDEMLSNLVAKLHEFWAIIPSEIGCDLALTQNTQFYDNYKVPDHMKADALFKRHKSSKMDESNDHDSEGSEHSDRSNIENEHDLFNMNAFDHNGNGNDNDNDYQIEREKEENEAMDDGPLYTKADLHSMSQNHRYRNDETQINESLPLQMDFSMDPNAENMDNYTLDFDEDNTFKEENNLNLNGKPSLLPTLSFAELPNDSDENEDIEMKENENTKQEKNENPNAILPKQKKMKKALRVSTRSRRKNKEKCKPATSHLLQSKSFMASQMSQIQLDDEEHSENEDENENDNEHEISLIFEEDKEQSVNTSNNQNIKKISKMTIEQNENENKKVSKKFVSKRSITKTKKRKKKKSKLSKLESIGLVNNELIDGEYCSVCCQEVDDIGVYCDGCNVFVHMQCYGIVTKPKKSEKWFCDPCKRDLSLMANNGANIECVICKTNKDTAYKMVKGTNAWAHVSCALWLTGVNFVDKTTLCPIEIGDVDQDRYKLRCIFCKQRGGACLQCELCTYSFHVPCAKRGTAMLELREADDRLYFHSFCPLHCDEESRKKVPDNNHDFPTYPSKKKNKKNRKRKRNEAMDDNDDNESTPKPVCKRRKKITENMNLSPIRSPDVRKRKLEHSAPVILCSKLDLDQLDDWHDFQTKFRSVCTFVSSWKHNVTHLVTSATMKEGKGTLNKRTIKYFQSIIAGSWVVCFDWIEECLSNNALCDEEQYEVLADNKGKNACKRSRELRNIKHDDGLFHDLVCVIASEFTFKNLNQDLRCIFRMGGAKLMKMLPYAWLKDVENKKRELQRNGQHFVFVYDKSYEMTNKQKDFCQKLSVKAVGYDDVFDAISCYKSISLKR